MLRPTSQDGITQAARRPLKIFASDHGSHNATPKRFVQNMLPEGTCAMASTLTRTIWPDIPRSPLLKALTPKKVSVARSDQPGKIAKVQIDRGVIETRIPL